MTASLTLTYGALNLTATPYLIEFGMDGGAPQNVYDVLAFMLQDGEVVLSPRASNRTLQFNVLIEGASLTALATAEAALVAETEKPLNTVTVDPGDGAPAAVYETFRGQVTLARDDGGEIARLRRYTVTVQAAPFVRSAAETVTAALAATGVTTTLVDDGSATTNWTGTVNGGATSPAVSSGAVGLTSSALTGDVTLSLTRTAAITTSSTKYIVVDYRPTVGGYSEPHAVTDLRAYGDGVELSRIATVTVSSTTYRATFVTTASSIAALRLDLVSHTAVGRNAPAWVRTFFVDNINRSDVRPTIGSGRQQLRSVALVGSAPTPGSLVVEHASNALGDVMVYAWANQSKDVTLYVPALRQYRTSGGTITADTAMVSGSRDDLNGTSIVYDIPMTALPQGLYLICARAGYTSSYSTGRIDWSAQTIINSTAIDTAVTGGAGSLSVSTTYTIYPVGRVMLPTSAVRDRSTATLRLTVTTTGSHMFLDEVWLFNTSIGQFIQVACGTGAAASGGPSRRLLIDAPNVATPRPGILRGHASDGSDAFYSAVRAWQQPQFDPPVVNVFTVTTNTADADVSFRAYPRWHTNPAS